MIKFKDGDIVQRVNSLGGARGIKMGIDLTVYRVDRECDMVYVRDAEGNTGGLFSERFAIMPVEELPPAPDSVMYFNSNATHGNDQRLIVDTGFDGGVLVNVVRRGCKYNHADVTNVLAVGLEPDDAIQLAHDIYRMARAAKKAQEGKA